MGVGCGCGGGISGTFADQLTVPAKDPVVIDVSGSASRHASGSPLRSLHCDGRSRLLRFPAGWPKFGVSAGEVRDYCGSDPDVAFEAVVV